MSAESATPNMDGLNLATPRLALPLIPEGVRQSTDILNYALKVIDHLIPYPVVEDVGYNEPSDVTQVDGDTFFVDPEEDEDWDNKELCYALYVYESVTENNSWFFISPARAMFCLPLANAGVAYGTLRPYQRTNADTTATWVAVS